MPDYKPDKIQKLKCGSIIQHGSFNNRIYLIKTGKKVSSKLAKELIELAKKKKYTKVFAKTPAGIAKDFIDSGFIQEAHIPGLYNDKEDVLFLGYFLDSKRKIEKSKEKVEKVMKLARKKVNHSAKPVTPPKDAILRPCNKKDAERMSKIYKKVYMSYPFPIDDPEYIAETMESDFDYFCVEKDNKIVALSSFELFKNSNSVEMTDFATLPDFRGNGYANMLLKTMESQTKKRKLKTAFTVARAVSPGMNITFAKNGYIYGGRLTNNTNISGNIESMNVWYKKL
ncbi:MAG: putative beta-lysine N-acetyltransferase [Sedimentisphaerales bacterium]|nr:putative beta-lysine N-acetyltransferase [Sedimentisphaerales bacterium]